LNRADVTFASSTLEEFICRYIW